MYIPPQDNPTPSELLAKPALFELGTVVATGGFLHFFEDKAAAELTGGALALIYTRGDWGLLCDEDKALNDAALDPATPGRILAKYEVQNKDMEKESVYIVTEWDRSSTTIMLTSEY